MTDRHAGYVVTLEDDVREDDAEAIMTALRMLRGVADVRPVPADSEFHMAVERAKFEIRKDVAEVLTSRLWGSP